MRWLVLVLPLVIGCGGSSQATWNAAKTAAPSHALDITSDDAARELPLKGVRNARDFAGLVGTDGPIPPDHFFRTANLSHLTEDDKKVLLAHGVKLVVDLRTVWERSVAPDPLARDPRFRYVHISLMGLGLFDALYTIAEYGALYVHALDGHQYDFQKVFHALASEKDGAVLFHCTAGKDRTGLVSAMLLDLAGVDYESIVHNYALSSHYLHTDPSDTRASATRDAPPEAIQQFLRVLDGDYGGARHYLKTIGVSDEDIDTLLERLGQTPNAE